MYEKITKTISYRTLNDQRIISDKIQSPNKPFYKTETVIANRYAQLCFIV